MVKKTPDLLTTPLVAPAIVSIAPTNNVKTQTEENSVHNVISTVHSKRGPIIAHHVHEESATVVHYSLPSFGKFIECHK